MEVSRAQINHLSPVHYHADEREDPPPQSGIGLCLSGGGYRAMLFHAGALWRLNEARYLPRLDLVSSVSGGSIAAAVLATRWRGLGFANGYAEDFEEAVVHPLRDLAGRTIDLRVALAGTFLPGPTNERLVSAYRRWLFGDATLASLPDRDAPGESRGPNFVFNATNLQSGALWEFSKAQMGDRRVGYVPRPRVKVAQAVASSAAFPPFLSPARLKLADADYSAPTPPSEPDLSTEPYTTAPALSDGGVYDNLGLDQPWKTCRTVLISDAGGYLDAPLRISAIWTLQMRRVTRVIDNQVRALRKRQAISGFRLGFREGAYWSIRSHVEDFPVGDPLPCPPEKTLELAAIRTRLAKLPGDAQKRLINWGYAMTDVGMRGHVDPTLPPPGGFPYPAQGVG
jgi:NTE family protein